MGKRPDHAKPPSARGDEGLDKKVSSAGAAPVSKKDYLALAALLGGRESVQRVFKRDAHGEALIAAGQLYENREFVAAYERFKPAYDKIASDMQRVLARNVEFEANKVAQGQRKPLAAAKEYVLKMKTHAQQVVDQVDRLLKDLESKPLVRVHLKKSTGAGAHRRQPVEEAPPTTLNSANETRVAAKPLPPDEVFVGDRRYRKAPYVPPQQGALYSVRDKSSGERMIRVIGNSADGTMVRVEILEPGRPSHRQIQLAVDTLARQGAKGWCHLLVPIVQAGQSPNRGSAPDAPSAEPNVALRLDSQNFGRCCADIVRANIKFSTQLIKDVGDGPFRAGNYEQAFLTFEQLAMGFNSAVANSRREIADGRRALNAEKTNLSGKEIQDRTAAFARSEQLIHTAEREFSTILEGLRMYLGALQGTSEPTPTESK
jgi:hypothetical protein